MDLIPAPEQNLSPEDAPLMPVGRDSSGVALFMVIAAVSVLAILVSEFTYIAQVSQSIAYGGLDQAKAHYIAKSGLKLSLLRLKAYQQVKKLVAGSGGATGTPTGGIPGVPNSVLDKIWSFPFFYPIPTNLPGMSVSDKDSIEKFQKESGIDGRFSAVIESESSKYNLNLLLPNYVVAPSAGPSGAASGTPPATQSSPLPGTSSVPQTGPSASASFDPQAQRDGLYNYLNGILTRKIEDDADFATNYRDFKLDELVDNIAAWVDREYNRQTSSSLDKIPMKRAPFYSLSELHMLPTMDDELYNLFAPSLTVSSTTGINVNTMVESTLTALVPQMLPDERTEFFKFRDSTDADNQFKDGSAFMDYLSKNVAAFRNQTIYNNWQTDIAKKNINFITDEKSFKISVQAQVNNAYRTIEAWVTLGDAPATSPSGTPSGVPSQTPAQQQPITGSQTSTAAAPAPSKSGLRITFMRIL